MVAAVSDAERKVAPYRIQIDTIRSREFSDSGNKQQQIVRFPPGEEKNSLQEKNPEKVEILMYVTARQGIVRQPCLENCSAFAMFTGVERSQVETD
ncbi:hypothetical protein Ancab_020689 [Ancistrocladus abbreviatus]